MNKIKKLCLGLALGFFVLPYVKVEALDYGLLECTYTGTYISNEAATGISNMQSGQASASEYTIDLVYSDYRYTSDIENPGVEQSIGLYNFYTEDYTNNRIIEISPFLGNYRVYDRYGLVGYFANTHNYWYDSDGISFNYRAETSFKTALNKSTGCPKYLYFQETIHGGESQLDAHFTNEKPSICSSETNSNEPCHILMEGKTTFASLMDPEKRWSYSSSCDNEKNNKIYADITLYSVDNILKYDAINRNASGYLATEDETNKAVHNVNILSIYNLEKNIPQDMGYNPKEKGSKKSWLSGVCLPDKEGNFSCGETFCRYENRVVNSDFTCTTFDKVEGELKDLYSQANTMFQSATSIASNHLKYQQGSYKEDVTKQYLAKTKEELLQLPLNELVQKQQQMDNANDMLNTYVTGFETYIDSLKRIKETLCISSAFQVDEYSQKAEQQMAGIKFLSGELKNTIINLKDALVEQKASEEQITEAIKTIQKYEELEQKIYELYRISQQNLLANTNFKLNNLNASGCGVLSPDMIAFLETILWYIRIAGVVLAIILSLVDFVKASMSSDEKAIAGVNKRFVTRIILVAVLFLVPVILDFLLNTLNIGSTAGSLKCVR